MAILDCVVIAPGEVSTRLLPAPNPYKNLTSQDLTLVAGSPRSRPLGVEYLPGTAPRDEREHLGSEWTKSTEQLFLDPCRSGWPGLLFMQFKHEWYGWYRRYWFRLLLRLTIHTVSLPCISRLKGRSLTGFQSCGQILKCETANLKQDCARDWHQRIWNSAFLIGVLRLCSWIQKWDRERFSWLSPIVFQFGSTESNDWETVKRSAEDSSIQPCQVPLLHHLLIPSLPLILVELLA